MRLPFTFIAVALTTLVSPAAAAEKPTNVVLFLVDDMGWMDSTPYGSQYYETPNMERLAVQSMRFTDAYAIPLCSPTRASILTGQYSSRHGITSASGHQAPRPADFDYLPETAPPNAPLIMPISKNYLDHSQYTLAEALRDAGYQTGHFGKWHLGLTEPHWPDKYGFDVAWHSQPSPGPPGKYFSPYGVFPPGVELPKEKGKRFYRGTITDGPDGEYITDRLTDEAVSFIRKNKTKPFFLNLWQFGVHGPWGHKEAYTKEFAKKTDPSGRQNNPVMASMLKSVDDSLGRVLDTLDELGIADNTLVIFYSDNGGNTHSMTKEEGKPGRSNLADPTVASYRKWAGYKPPTNNAPLREGKARIYEGGQRVPLMVRWPGRIEAGSTSNAIVGPIDIYPTILDGLGLDPSPEQTIDGESLLPVLTQSAELKRDALFTWFPHIIPAVSVRQGDWKLIRRFSPHRDYPEVRELYNLSKDISETNNLAESMPDKVTALDALIDEFVKQTGALYPQPNPAYQPRPVSPGTPDRGPAFGLVPKFCELTVTENHLLMEADGRKPFLGTAQVKLNGPLTLKLRARSRSGGQGQVHWRTPNQETFPETGQSVDFTLAGGNEWQNLEIHLPVHGKTQTIRLFLPAHESPVKIEEIHFSNSQGNAKHWQFSKGEN